jgi:hypothetical protein
VLLVQIVDINAVFVLDRPQQVKRRIPPSPYIRLLVPEQYQLLQRFTAHVNLVLIVFQYG